ARRVLDAHADGVLAHGGGLACREDSDAEVAHLLRVAGTRAARRGRLAARHLHRPGTLHGHVAHAEGAHHPHHALGRLELALRIDQEVSAGDDALAGRDAVQHLDRIVEASAQADLARHEAPVAAVGEHHLAASSSTATAIFSMTTPTIGE